MLQVYGQSLKLAQSVDRHNEKEMLVTRMTIPVCLFVGCFCWFLSPSQVSANPSASFSAGLGSRALVPGDHVPSGTTIDNIGTELQSYIWVNSGPIGGASMTQTLPGGIEGAWGYGGMYFNWNDGTNTATWDALGPINQNDSFSATTSLAVPSAPMTTPIGITRWISDPVFVSDIETRTVRMTLDIAAGALSGAYNRLEVNILPDWNLPEGISYTVNSTALPPTGFSALPYNGVSFGSNGAVALGDLNGSYEFSAEIEVTRSGPRTQANYGNMYFKPGMTVWYANASPFAPVTGSSVNQALGGGYSASASSSDVVDWQAQRTVDRREFRFESITTRENVPVSVNEIFLIKEKRSTVSGETMYFFDVEILGENMVAGTLTTPNAQVYDLAVEAWGEEEGAEFWYAAASEAGLAAMDFVNGDYVITLEDHNGVQTQYTVSLAGDYPAAMPQWDQAPQMSTDVRQTLSWLAPGADIDAVIFEMWSTGDEFNEYLELFRGTDDLDALTSWTPSDDLDYRSYFMYLGFFDGQIEDTGGISRIAGYMVGDDANMNIVVPEPATLSLLALGGLAVLKRRRK